MRGTILDAIQIEAANNALGLHQLDDMCDSQDTAGIEDALRKTGCEDEGAQGVEAWRQPEMRKFEEMGVYDYVSLAEAKAACAGKLIDATWVDDWLKRKSRLVAREYARGENRDDLFSPTPSLLASKVLTSECASG